MSRSFPISKTLFRVSLPVWISYGTHYFVGLDENITGWHIHRLILALDKISRGMALRVHFAPVSVDYDNGYFTGQARKMRAYFHPDRVRST